MVLQRVGVHHFRAQREFPADDPVEVEQVVDEPELELRVAADHPHVLPHIVR